MDTTVSSFDGCELVVPIINGQPLHFPHKDFGCFDTYCGAGSGIGDLIVPDVIYEVPVSVACYIHDMMWRYCAPTVEDFNQSNLTFFENIVRIITYFVPIAKNDKYRVSRYQRAATYYAAVQTGIGPYIFSRMKHEQATAQEVMYEGNMAST